MLITRRSINYATIAAAASLSLASLAPSNATAQRLAPIQYTVSMPAPETHVAHVQARIPTDGKPYVDLMMAVWPLGYYMQENYATHVQDISAEGTNGRALTIEHPQPNRWRITTGGSSTISYYDKGLIAGLVLYARIQHATNGRI